MLSIINSFNFCTHSKLSPFCDKTRILIKHKSTQNKSEFHSISPPFPYQQLNSGQFINRGVLLRLSCFVSCRSDSTCVVEMTFAVVGCLVEQKKSVILAKKGCDFVLLTSFCAKIILSYCCLFVNNTLPLLPALSNQCNLLSHPSRTGELLSTPVFTSTLVTN